MRKQRRETGNGKRETVSAIALLLIASAPVFAQHDHAAMMAAKADAPAAEHSGKMVEFPSGSEKATGYLALPSGGGTHPAVVVIQEWWGLNDFVKGKADMFAKMGYVALAPDLYRGKVSTYPYTAHQLMRV